MLTLWSVRRMCQADDPVGSTLGDFFNFLPGLCFQLRRGGENGAVHIPGIPVEGLAGFIVGFILGNQVSCLLERHHLVVAHPMPVFQAQSVVGKLCRQAVFSRHVHHPDAPGQGEQGLGRAVQLLVCRPFDDQLPILGTNQLVGGGNDPHPVAQASDGFYIDFHIQTLQGNRIR